MRSIQYPKESSRENAYPIEWVGYTGQRASESQLRGGLNMVTSQGKLTMLRTQTRGHPGTFGIYCVCVLNRRTRNLSNGLDNALIQQEISVYNLSAILPPSPNRRISYDVGWCPFLEPVRHVSFEEVGRRARFQFESSTSQENLLGIERYPL